jgi:hypothetical protein
VSDLAVAIEATIFRSFGLREIDRFFCLCSASSTLGGHWVAVNGFRYPMCFLSNVSSEIRRPRLVYLVPTPDKLISAQDRTNREAEA